MSIIRYYYFYINFILKNEGGLDTVLTEEK